MLVEQVSNGFVVAPGMNHRSWRLRGHLAGAYGGVIMDKHAAHRGGCMGSRTTRTTRAAGLWRRRGGLAATRQSPIGSAWRGSPVSEARTWPSSSAPLPHRVRVRQAPLPDGRPNLCRCTGARLFVFEPRERAFNFSRTMRLNVGVGYRIIAGAGSANDSLRGMSGQRLVELRVLHPYRVETLN